MLVEGFDKLVSFVQCEILVETARCVGWLQNPNRLPSAVFYYQLVEHEISRCEHVVKENQRDLGLVFKIQNRRYISGESFWLSAAFVSGPLAWSGRGIADVSFYLCLQINTLSKGPTQGCGSDGPRRFVGGLQAVITRFVVVMV